MKISSLSVAKRLFGGFSIIIFISVAVSAFVYMKSDHVADKALTVTETRVPTVILQQDILNHYYQTLVEMRGILLTRNSAASEDVIKIWGEIAEKRAQVDELSKKWIVEKNRQRWSEIKILLDGTEKAQREALQLVAVNSYDEAIAHIKTNVFPKVVRVELLVTELTESQRGLMMGDSKELHDEINVIALLLVLSSVLVIVLGFLISLIITRSVVNPLASIIGTMESMEKGALGSEVGGQERKDEIGTVARTLEKFRLSLSVADQERRRQAENVAREVKLQERKIKMTEDFVAETMSVIETLGKASHSLQDAAQSLNDTARVSQEKATSVSAASEEASTNVQTVSAAGEELSASILEISRQVNSSIEIADSAVTETGRSNKQIEELAEAAKQIGTVVQLIHEIASQTNLLALNATIEAARAGDAGKGFAVVAAEVKSLASETAKATQEISEKVTEIQGSSTQAVDAVQRINKIVGDINMTSNAIAAAVEEQSSATQEISRSVQEAAQGTMIVAKDMVDVSNSALETGTLANRIKSAADELADISRNISLIVNTFASNINSAAL